MDADVSHAGTPINGSPTGCCESRAAARSGLAAFAEVRRRLGPPRRASSERRPQLTTPQGGFHKTRGAHQRLESVSSDARTVAAVVCSRVVARQRAAKKAIGDCALELFHRAMSDSNAPNADLSAKAHSRVQVGWPCARERAGPAGRVRLVTSISSRVSLPGVSRCFSDARLARCCRSIAAPNARQAFSCDVVW